MTVLVAAITSPATFFAGRWWGRYKAGRQWHKKEFLDRITVSLNIFADGFLKIRTVMERSLEEVFLNRLAIDKVWAAARKTTVENPVMPVAKAGVKFDTSVYGDCILYQKPIAPHARKATAAAGNSSGGASGEERA